MYRKPIKEDWQGRVDATDGVAGFRWHQLIRLLDLSNPLDNNLLGAGKKIAFLGFCSDEGVRRNNGRVGAAKGPSAIRKAASNLAVHFSESDLLLFDAGDVICANNKLEEAQQLLAAKVQILLEKGFFPLVLGGGHEVAYGHFCGINNHIKKQGKDKLGIINFDAHFDLRAVIKEATSGTPFRQILEENEHYHNNFPYLCLGIQEANNTKALFDVAYRNFVKYIFSEDVNFRKGEHLTSTINTFINSQNFIYLSVDLDVFSAAFAPGVSAVNANGIFPDIAIYLLKEIIASGKVLSIDIAELNPEHDIDDRTAKLAASLIYEIVKAIKIYFNKN